MLLMVALSSTQLQSPFIGERGHRSLPSRRSYVIDTLTLVAKLVVGIMGLVMSPFN
jgi:hypothetical protein